jgi:hypothetical protein
MEYRGLIGVNLSKAEWKKSSHSGAEGGNCVEVATNIPGVVAVRDSKNPHGPALASPPPSGEPSFTASRATSFANSSGRRSWPKIRDGTVQARGDLAAPAPAFAAVGLLVPLLRDAVPFIGKSAGGLWRAHAYLLAGEIEQAAATVLDLGSGLRLISSARVRHQLRQLRTDGQPHRGNPKIAEADRLVTAVG